MTSHAIERCGFLGAWLLVARGGGCCCRPYVLHMRRRRIWRRALIGVMTRNELERLMHLS